MTVRSVTQDRPTVVGNETIE